MNVLSRKQFNIRKKMWLNEVYKFWMIQYYLEQKIDKDPRYAELITELDKKCRDIYDIFYELKYDTEVV